MSISISTLTPSFRREHNRSLSPRRLGGAAANGAVNLRRLISFRNSFAKDPPLRIKNGIAGFERGNRVDDSAHPGTL